uniref:Protein piccolo n=1 Tax=Haemonchus contortus TaxID=6289 RepID=A0A7I4Y8D6_HAECO
MADPELASKLAKRLESVDDTVTDSSKAETPPPPVPKMPEKVVPNPYVAVDNTVSIDDLIAKAMERKEHPEENNNVTSPNGITMDDADVATATVNGHDTQPDIHTGPPPKRTLAELLAKDQERSVSPPHVSSPDTSRRTPPPKTTIGELLVKDKQPLSPPPTSKCPLVPVQHHVSKPSTRRLSPEDDGSELERKLAAQRAKKSLASVAATESNVIFSTPENSTPPQKPPRSEEPVKTAPVEDHEKALQPEETEKPPCSSSSQGSTPLPQESPPSGQSEKMASNEDHEKSPQPKEAEKPPCGEELEKLPRSEKPVMPSEQPAQNGGPEETVEGKEVKLEAKSETDQHTSELSTTEADQHISELSTTESDQHLPELNTAESSQPPETAVHTAETSSSQSEPKEESPAPPLPLSEPPTLPLNEEELKNLLVDEVKKCKITKEEMIVIKDMEHRKDTAAAKSFSPSRELLEMIQHENGIRSPPPIPPPKPQTPSHSRPQSPVVKKLSMPSVGATTTVKMFAERQNKPSSHMQKAYSQDNGDELSALLERRNKILQGESVPEMINKKLSLYAEFTEFSRKQIKFFTETFRKYDEDADGFIDFDELKRMMEKLGEAQTHIALKEIIRQVDEDKDGKISLREFFLIFRLAAQNQLGCSQVFQMLADSVDVSKEGVLGAASFFQAKIEEQTKLSRFEQEMKEEQEERKRLEEEKKARREKFLQNKSIFQ